VLHGQQRLDRNENRGENIKMSGGSTVARDVSVPVPAGWALRANHTSHNPVEVGANGPIPTGSKTSPSTHARWRTSTTPVEGTTLDQT
jgi:hypothetical protein